MIVEAFSVPPAGVVARPAQDVWGRGQGEPDFQTVLETVEGDDAGAAGDIGGKAGLSTELQGGSADSATPPGAQVQGPPLGLPAPSSGRPEPARAGQALPPQAPGPAPFEAVGGAPDSAPAPAVAVMARSFTPAPSSRAADPDVVPFSPVMSWRGDDGNGSPLTGQLEGVLAGKAPVGATPPQDLPTPLVRGDAVAAGARTANLPRGPGAEAGTGGEMIGIPALQPRPEVQTAAPHGDRAGPPNHASDTPDRLEFAAGPTGLDPGARGPSGTAPSMNGTARGGSWQADGYDRPAPAGPFAAPEEAGPAAGNPLAGERPEAAKGAADPEQAQAKPPQTVAADHASPRGPVLAGAEFAALATEPAKRTRAASAPEADDRGTEPPELAPLARVEVSRSAPEATEGRALFLGRSETKPDAITAPPPVIVQTVVSEPGAPLADGASAIPMSPGFRAPEDGASGGAPLPAQGPARSVAMQLAAAVSVDRQGAVEIRLSPEELGVVKLTLQVADGTVALAIEAERPETLELMRRSLDVLEREFREAGFESLNLSFGHRGGNRQPERPAAYASAFEDRPAAAENLTQGHSAPVPRVPSSAQLDLRL